MSPKSIIEIMRDAETCKQANQTAWELMSIYNYSIECKSRSDHPEIYKRLINQLKEHQAKYLYFKHMRLGRNTHSFMWEQCSKEVREAWRVIANADVENPLVTKEEN